MNTSGRGWSGAPQHSKPAAEYDIRYGSNLLRRESARWPRYVIVPTPRAYRAAQPHLAQPPAGIGYAELLDWDDLQALSDAFPAAADLVVGLGGGRALDASKYVALTKDLPLILVPTVVSTGAIIHSTVAKWSGRMLIGPGDRWPWVDPEHVLVDYDLVLAAAPYLNTAGLGDVLCGYAGIAEWRCNARRGVGPPTDDAAISTVLAFHDELAHGFPATLDAAGDLTPASVRFIMDALLGREIHRLPPAAAPGGDHDFVFALELANDKGWIHGEVVALGAIIIAWQCAAPGSPHHTPIGLGEPGVVSGEHPEELIARLDACRVRRRPTDMGISREELWRGLAYTPTYMGDTANGRDTNSIMRHEPVTGAQFAALWQFLEGS